MRGRVSGCTSARKNNQAGRVREQALHNTHPWYDEFGKFPVLQDINGDVQHASVTESLHHVAIAPDVLRDNLVCDDFTKRKFLRAPSFLEKKPFVCGFEGCDPANTPQEKKP